MKSLEQQAEETGLSRKFLGDERRLIAFSKDVLLDTAYLAGGALLLPFSVTMSLQKVPENQIDAWLYVGMGVLSAGMLVKGVWGVGKMLAYATLSLCKREGKIMEEYIRNKYPHPELLLEVKNDIRR